MRITLIGLHFSEYALNLARALSAEHTVQLLLSKKNAENELELLPETLGNLHIHYFQHTTSVGVILKNFWLLKETICAFTPDVIHIQEDPKDYLTLSLPWLQRYPMLLTVHDPRPHSGTDATARKFSRHRLSYWALRKRADAYVVHGKKLKEITEDLYPQMIGRVFSIPHGVLGYKPSLNPAATETGTVLFAGRIEKYKGLGVFIEAIHIARKKLPEIRGIIAGRGEALNEHRGALDAPSFELIDRFLSPTEFVDTFSRADIVALPYLDGTQSGIAAYALGCGKPAVASDVGSIPEMIRSDENGILVPPGNATALADAIVQIVGSPEKREKMAQAARRLADTDFSWNTAGAMTIAAYENVRAKFQR